MTLKKYNADLIFKEECYSIVGACFEVYKDKGNGFHEPVYQECMGIEFEHQQIPAIAQPSLTLEYRGRKLEHKYIPDFICYEKIILELKAVNELSDDHRSQVLHYLKATGFQLGILVNFGSHPKVQYERIAKSHTSTSNIKEDIYL